MLILFINERFPVLLLMFMSDVAVLTQIPVK